MLMTLPLLYGAWVLPRQERWARRVALAGLVVAVLGILLAASRSAFVVLMLVVIFASVSGDVSMKNRVVWVVVLLSIGVAAASNSRLQRFTTLRDTDYVESRIAGSVNRKFFEVLLEYPMGNGLGGGGSSIPYFWEGNVRQPVGIENEYGRILLEQSAVGLVLWVSFLVWLFTRSAAFARVPWREARRLGWFLCLICFCTGTIGVGMFTSVPQALLMFLMIGWGSTRESIQVHSRYIVRAESRMREYPSTTLAERKC
jgi:hypothetical protein